MLLKSDHSILDSPESAVGEDTRKMDVKIEETKENMSFDETNVKKEDNEICKVKVEDVKEEKEQSQEPLQEQAPVSTAKVEGGKRRRDSAKDITPLKTEALMPNSTSMPILQNTENTMIDNTATSTPSLKSAGNVSSKCIPKIEEGKNSEEMDLSNPHNLLIYYLREDGYNAYARKAATLPDFFLEVTDKQIEAYSTELVKAIRDRNIPLLREMHASGKTLQCSNRFGESLLHMACRRGYTDVVRFLIEEADVTLRVKDDFGRTPLHDACWSANPNFDLMELIIEHDPDLLLIEDVRGHSPFSYARKSHWKDWSRFLTVRRKSLRLNTFTE
jgi:hypothetical protein